MRLLAGTGSVAAGAAGAGGGVCANVGATIRHTRPAARAAEDGFIAHSPGYLEIDSDLAMNVG
jgi:hypothetical protein